MRARDHLARAGAAAMLLACGEDEPLGVAGDAGTPAPTYTWYRDVLLLVQLRCRGCHALGGLAFAWLDSYSDTAGLVDVGILEHVIADHVSLRSELDANGVSCASAGCHGYAHPFTKVAPVEGAPASGGPDGARAP